ncbi:EAL domain-containing protein [Photobacterium sanctipauli]|uniref:EAL domain-containing protein n=1 Tax=Photobacterium sanctipauli TaxID=1342794 RepID=A0A2T3NYQ3_9GAMM|nr:EAL domain-containing protein [Photobacterium sanctipauli]PSW21339.1 EAL domain-containing protein [Photobacterium sanctipauli]
MQLTFWLRWRFPSFVFLFGLIILALSSNWLSERLFERDVTKRLDNLHSFYQGRYLAIADELDTLASQLNFNCKQADLNALRSTIEESVVIQLIEIQTNNISCSIYGKEISSVKEFTKSDAKLINKGNYRYTVEPYFNHRIKITFRHPEAQLITITEPFQNIFTDSETCPGCVAMVLEYNGENIPIYSQASGEQYQFIASKHFSQHYLISILATSEGIKHIVREDLIEAQLLIASILLSLCLLLGVRNNPERSLQDQIALGLKSKEFLPYFQPIINTKTNNLVGSEVLLRWKKPNGDQISPQQFIPIAEYNGQINDLTQYLISDVTAKGKELLQQLPGTYLSLNVTPAMLESHSFAEGVLTIIKRNKLPATFISFEVTERTPFSDLKKAEAVISRLRQQGVMVKLDDAGTGYGGFSYLQELPIETLKIDKMFIDTIGTNDMKSKILDAIILFGKHAGLKLIAEGVETQEQVSYLQAKGVWLMQGYFFSKPISYAEYLKYKPPFLEQPITLAVEQETN